MSSLFGLDQSSRLVFVSDLLGHTPDGVAVAIEVAYSSFCDPFKVAQFVAMSLPALEIDLRAFTPSAFEPEAVRDAVLERTGSKRWLWPVPPTSSDEPELAAPFEPAPEALAEIRTGLPEEIVSISGRWVSIKTFPSGDIAVKVVRYDPDLVSMVKTIARDNHGRYAPRWKSWNIPRWRAEVVRASLRSKSQTVAIAMSDSA